VNRQGLTHHITYAEHGKPVSLPQRVGRPQGPTMEARVKEGGESEGRPVMGRIGIEPMASSSRAKASRLPPGLSLRKSR